MGRSQSVSYLLDSLDRAVLSHLCPGKTSISYTEDRWDVSHYRVSPSLLVGRDKSGPYRAVPVSHLISEPILAETLLPWSQKPTLA